MLRTSLLLLLGSALGACGQEPSSPQDAGLGDDTGTDAGLPDSGCVPVEASSEPISVDGEVGSLGGTLEIPQGCAPFPIVVILSGSGSTDRDGNDPDFGGPACYEALAFALRDAGIASIRYDDHGIGESANAAPVSVEDFRFDLEVADAARWAAAARSDPRFDRVFFAGHSQGSLTALLAMQSESVDGIVSLAGTSLPAGRLLLAQLTGRLTPDEFAALEAAVAELEMGRTVADLPPRVAMLLPPILQAYLISWFRFDPIAEAQRSTVPLLVVHGTTDHTVPLAHAKMLAGAREGTEIAIIEGMSHVLKQAGDDRASQERARTDPTVPLGEGLAAAVSDFVHGTMP